MGRALTESAAVSRPAIISPGEVTARSVLAFLNIHHSFTDGVMWKLRNPAVRQDGFGHRSAPATPKPVQLPSAAKSKRERRERWAAG